MNPGDKAAEERFKRITEAHEVLSDPKKRKVYDRFGQYSDQLADAAARGTAGGEGAGRGVPFDFAGFDWSNVNTSASSSTGGGSSFRDIFSELFGGGRQEKEPPRPMPRKGDDIEMPLALSFEEAVTGLTTNITVNRSEQCPRCNGAARPATAQAKCSARAGACASRRSAPTAAAQGNGVRRAPCATAREWCRRPSR
ncbi:MAG: hypothetical protein DMF66_18135 [Acidobacteria bacterium]|nr:MAG: hypothetical protein DMF66_18135 [Acidobacteriota bacterium]